MQALNTLNAQPDYKEKQQNVLNSENKMRALRFAMAIIIIRNNFQQMTKFETYELNIEYIIRTLLFNILYIMADTKKTCSRNRCLMFICCLTITSNLAIC